VRGREARGTCTVGLGREVVRVMSVAMRSTEKGPSSLPVRSGRLRGPPSDTIPHAAYVRQNYIILIACGYLRAVDFVSCDVFADNYRSHTSRRSIDP